MANSALTIGRLGLSVSTGTDIRPYPDLKFDGDRVSFSGDLIASGVDEAKVLRQQLNGYGPHNTDEPVVAVTWTDDDSIDGFYYVMGTEVSTIAASYLDGKGWFPFSIDLLRVEGYQAPLHEVAVVGALRTNEVGVTSGTVSTWVGLPQMNFDLVTLGTSASTAGPFTTSDSNSASIVYLSSTNDWVVYTPQDVTSGMVGAATIQTSTNGTTFSTVVGRQFPNGSTAKYVRLTNDHTRVTTSGTNSILVDTWDNAAGAWESTEFGIGVYSGGFTNGSINWTTGSTTVLRNAVEVASVRLALHPSGVDQHGYVDLTVRRGSPIVEGYRWVKTAVQVAVYRTAAEAATAITGGIEATSANAAGNKFTILSPTLSTVVTSNTSGIYSTNATLTYPFAVSPRAGALPGTTKTVAGTYFSASEHRSQVVAR